MKTYYSLYGRLLSMPTLFEAFKRVKKNKAAAGVDGQSVSDFSINLGNNLHQLLLELKEKRYRAQPVKRVEIDKDDGGKRLLGIPTVRDRIVQQCLTNIMTPIFDPHFHPSNYGYRPGRSGHHAFLDLNDIFMCVPFFFLLVDALFSARNKDMVNNTIIGEALFSEAKRLAPIKQRYYARVCSTPRR